MITKAYHNYKQMLTFESIVSHRMDHLTAGRPVDPLTVAVASDDVGQAMFKLIKRRGLLPELLMALDLCSLCLAKRGRAI